MLIDQEKKKVLILYNNLFHYRLPIFRLLAKKCDLTVAYSIGPETVPDFNFKVVKLPVFKFNRFIIHKCNLFQLCQKYDVVIAYGDISWLKISLLPFYKSRKFRLLYWTIGVSASYNKKFDEIKKWDYIRDFFYKKADALIFYTDYPINQYIKRGYSKKKLFVAPNTVEVLNDNIGKVAKNSILFIGTLYMQKGLLNLLNSYKLALEIDPNLPILNIIGGGDEFDSVHEWIKCNNLEAKAVLCGPQYDSLKKANFFNKSLACISPNQAGLSVLESMGYGVPFITKSDSITGGERLNITNGINGILYNDTSQLTEIILDISNNPNKYILMGNNAKDYYYKYRRPTDMANGILSAIEYVTT